VWDKDVLKRDYLGEVGVPVEAWFGDDEQDQELRAKRWEADGNVVSGFHPLLRSLFYLFYLHIGSHSRSPSSHPAPAPPPKDL
jgi:hypothetical protein